MTSTSVVSEDALIVALVGDGVSGWWLDAEADSNGIPVVAYVAEDGALRVLRCRDVNCENGFDQLDIGYSGFGEPLEFDMALGLDGSPVVVVQSWGLSFATVHSCLDPSCSDVAVVELADPEPCVWPDGQPCEYTVDFPRIAVAADGLVRVAYLTNTNPRSVKIATSQGRDSGAWELSVVAQYPADTGSGGPSFRIDAQDRAIVGYDWDKGYDRQGAVVAVCADPSCATDPQIVFEIEGGNTPVTTEGSNGDFLVWYQTGSAALPPELATPEAMEQGASAFPAIFADYADFMVASCRFGGCDEPQYVPPGEDWLVPPNLRLYTTENGNPAAFFHHASRNEPTPQLHFTACADPECSDGSTLALGIATDETPRALDIVSSPGATPTVFYAVNGALNLYTCTACTAP